MPPYPKFATGDDAAMLMALYFTIDGWKDVFSGNKAEGLTKDDVKKLEELAKDKDFFRKSDEGAAVQAHGSTSAG